MENNSQVNSSANIKRAPIHEGPRNHFISFAISIVLTLLAFIAVANPNLPRTFIMWFIMLLALAQAIVQLLFWMHLKDPGHNYARIGIAFGAVIFLSAVVSAVYWTWL